MVILNFKLFLFFLTVFVAPTCFNEFLSLLDAAWVNKALHYIVLYCIVLKTRKKVSQSKNCRLSVASKQFSSSAFQDEDFDYIFNLDYDGTSVDATIMV